MNKEILTKEIDDLEMLIGAVSSEIAEQLSSNDRSESADELLKEMQEALSELRLARGVRLMLLNAFETGSKLRTVGSRYAHSNRQPSRPLRRAS